ncbi:MAG: FkbM family methyltransferase [Telmatospirillum sp.]|nr:FkbM family methyltransferase [Telmatospirillum sp.]
MTIDAFEPDVNALDKGYKQDGRVTWFPFGLAATSGLLPFYLTGVPSGSSLLMPNEAVMADYSKPNYGRIDKVLELPFFTFSEFITKHARLLPELIKLDTQGSELDILRSLDEPGWSDVIAVETEVEFAELYSNQPLFRDVDAFMAERGFYLLDLRTHRAYLHRNGRSDYYIRSRFDFSAPSSEFSARLLAGDALYIRAFPDGVPPDAARVGKLALVFCIYHFFDQAIALAEKAMSKGVMTPAQGEALIRAVVHSGPRPRFHERASGVIRRLLTGMRHVFAVGAKFVGYRLPRQGIYRAGWSLRAWPDQ